MAMWREMPSGREEAIETLVDMDPQGNFFRAARVLEESVPQALFHRPNLVTKAALIDQACALSKHEVDDHEKYDYLFGGNNMDNRISSNFTEQQLRSPISEAKQNRILRHHSKIMTAKKKREAKKKVGATNLAPSPQLVAALRRIYEKPGAAGSEHQLPASFKSLLDSVSNHPSFSAKDGSESGKGESSPPSIETTSTTPPPVTCSTSAKESAYSLESLIAYLCKESSSPTSSPFSATMEHGLLITILSVLMEYEAPYEVDPSSSTKKSQEASTERNSQDGGGQQHDATDDPTAAPPLQVGSIMCLLPSDEDGDRRNSDPWSVDNDLLSYFGEAAAVYEERIEIQKSRLLRRLSTDKGSEGKKTDPSNEGKRSKDNAADFNTPLITTAASLASPQPVVDTPATPDAVVTEVTEFESTAEALNAVFEHVVSAVAGEEASESIGDSNENDDDDGSDDDDDELRVQQLMIGSNTDDDDDDDNNEEEDEDNEEVHGIHEDVEDNASSCSSSSSSSSSDSDAEPENENAESNDDSDNEEENDVDDTVLRRALELSMSERPDTYSTRIDVSTNDADTSSVTALGGSPLGPVTPVRSPLSEDELENNPEVEESPLPAMPIPPPRVDLHASLRGPNADLDCSDHMQKDSMSFDPSALNGFGLIPASTVLIQLLSYMNAAMKRRKFKNNEERPTSGRQKNTDVNTTLGGIGSALFAPKRRSFKSESFDGKHKTDTAISLQLLVSLFLLTVDIRNDAIDNLKRALAQEKKSTQDGSCNRSGEEGDDPAIALSLYIDEENSDSKESLEALEAKGMRRKAAAAAHDAAALSKARRKRTNEWKQRVKFFSECCFLSIESLRLFLQGITRDWLCEHQGMSATDCHKLLPTSVISKLSIGLASLSSTGMIHSLHTLCADNNICANLSESIFWHSKLYKSSIFLWGETVPIVYPSLSAQVEVLRSLLAECSKYSESWCHHRLLDNQTSLPIPDSEPPIHRLQILSRRLRVSDLLNRYVSGPTCYLPETEIEEKVLELEEPNCARSVIVAIGSASISSVGLKRDLENLYLAVCHRYHVRVLLWDGLGTCTETEVNESPNSLTSSPAETLRVCSSDSNKIQFDATKCSDSISIISNPDSSPPSPSSSINQRASKVWGTVLSSTAFSPKTGIYRWAVRLDKCERGHVFIGVATAQASMRTYVGGDKYGWGMIGTQALWHDRRKIRGDYGATFRTGSTIIVTLDTDAGTIAYSLWNDNTSASSYSVDQVVQNISSPRRQGQGFSTIEDWGVAFEGLPLDSKLYPAVGLYQRDDKVTLLPVETAGNARGRAGSGTNLNEGLCYYPYPSESDNQMIEKIRSFNEKVQVDGTHYVISSLERIIRSVQEGSDEFLWKLLLPSLASAICLFPRSIPFISKRFGFTIMSRLSKAIRKLGESNESGLLSQGLFHNALQGGKWTIRATGSSGSNADAEEYVVDLTTSTENNDSIGFEGTGVGTIGKSKNGLVAIVGTVKGSSLHFVEEWTDASDEDFSSITREELSSSCVANARLSLDGTKFEGTYHNIQYGTSGHIAGALCGDSSTKVSLFHSKETPISMNKRVDFSFGGLAGQSLLCLAHSHLASIIGEDPIDDNIQGLEEWESHATDLKNCLDLKSFAKTSLQPSDDDISRQIQYLRDFYFGSEISCTDELLVSFELVVEGLCSSRVDIVNSSVPVEKIAAKVESIDGDMCSKYSGTGSLSVLCPNEYRRARHLLICAIITICRLDMSEISEGELKRIWTWALKLMEDGVRHSVAKKSDVPMRERATACCMLFCNISEFLLSLDTSSSSQEHVDIDTAGADFSRFYKIVSSRADIEFLKDEYRRATRKALLRLIPIQQIHCLVESCCENENAVESLLVGIPRLLGRGYIDVSRPLSDRHGSDYRDGLGGHYLSNTSGGARSILKLLDQSVHQLLNAICELVDDGLQRREKKNSSQSLISFDSMTLACLPCLTVVLQQEGIRAFVLNSKLLTMLPSILNTHRANVSPSDMNLLSEGEKSSVIKLLHDSSNTEISRAILRSTVALIHIISYQAWNVPDPDVCSEGNIVSGFLKILFEELDHLIPLVFDSIERSIGEARKSQMDMQWERFCEESSNADAIGKYRAKKNAHQHEVGRYGARFIQEYGMLTVGQPSSPSKASGSRKHVSPRHTPEKYVKAQGMFSHHFVSHWIHILVASVDNEASKEAIVQVPGWISTLFRAIGIKVDVRDGGIVYDSEPDDSAILLPARYRCRILRLLRPLLDTMTPSKRLVQSLFHLAGSCCNIITLNLDEDEGMVSRETVSLIRRLHSPSHVRWRACINSTMEEILLGSELQGGNLSRLGVLCFLNGSIDSIRKGARVLLKPAAAAPLSADRQAMSNSKSHSSAPSLVNSSPHHLVGNGTEGIVAGLCRNESSAGVVSSIDAKNGVCEVILLNRNSAKLENPDLSGEQKLISSRHTLTVRALRSPMTDIVQAQEVPIFIDESMPVERLLQKLIGDSVDILQMERYSQESTDNSVQISDLRSKMIDVTNALMSLRSSITLLSDENLVINLLKSEKSRALLSRVLQFAFPDNGSSEDKEDLMVGAKESFLSSFPMHEVRLLHVVSLFRGLIFEERILEDTPESIWNERLQEIRGIAETEASDSIGNNNDEDCTTSQIESDRVPDSPNAISAIDRSAGNISGRTEASEHRAASQSTAASDNSEEEEENEAAATAAAHLREAAIAQMAELGLPRSWSELALRRTGGTNIEAAVHFCLERGGEMERLLAEERERQSSGLGSSRRRTSRAEASSHLLSQLTEMGFPSRWCAEALNATGNNVDEALTWILTNSERLSAEDEGMEDVDDDEDDEDDDEDFDPDDEDSQETNDQPSDAEVNDTTNKNESNSLENGGWTGSIIPLRFISGRSIIDQKTLTISGLPSGGFSSVGSKGVMLTEGKWYYEAILETAGCLQIGWADGSFAGHCHSDRGDGCGDGPSSWAYDGWRRYRWHSMATEWGCRWTEGDVVGCLVDMDEGIVSFTLNGKAEEIGMGVAFSGDGFRPCGGVYACVSFNRREKLRLTFGGSGSAPFKYPPPPGYRGVGEAVLERVKERHTLVSKESILDDEREEFSEKKFLCDFSDGEHGHELMAWAHRYYGSDASVHLGSGRSKQSSSNSKNSSSIKSTENIVEYCLARRIKTEWAKVSSGSLSCQNHDEEASSGIEILKEMKNGLRSAGLKMCKQAYSEAMILSSLITRKLLLHVVITSGENFDPEAFFASDNARQESALRFWNMIEATASLRSAGWVGEAGAMAIAAEALGLGISSTESLHSRLSTLERAGFVSIADLDDGVLLPAGSITQVLNTVFDWDVEGSTIASTGNTLAASAEAAICSDGGGGILTFLLKGLQAAVIRSEDFRRVVIASIRRSVRQLAVVEYENDESTPSEDDKDDENLARVGLNSKEKKSKTELDVGPYPDARLVSYLTGLFLSKPVAKTIMNFEECQIELFEAWSVGLLSASLPWRMICALTTAGILNQCPSALPKVVKSFPTISRYYSRLRCTVSRRIWAERAAVPVCSRYCQAIVELLCSVTRVVNNDDVMLPSSFLTTWEKTAVDAATPLPMPEGGNGSDWEVEDGWVSSDRGWEIWTGTMKRYAVDWKIPSQSAVRTLMEGGDGPPMLREGCIVIRGVDWDEVKYGNGDGKDIYEFEKGKRDEEKKSERKVRKNSDGEGLENTEEFGDPVDDVMVETKAASTDTVEEETTNQTKKKKKKSPSPKLPIGTVLSIEPWDGIPGMARRVRWHLTGNEAVYRYGGDGGCYDIKHVEVNDRETRIRKHHPLPESAEQCASRHGFGLARCQSVLLRLRPSGKRESVNGEVEVHREGVMELPEFGSGIYVRCIFKPDNSIVLEEKYLLYGSKDSGWQARFGKPSYVSGTVVTLRPAASEGGSSESEIGSLSSNQSLYEDFVGTSTYDVENLRNREDGSKVQVKSELRLTRGRRSVGANSSRPLIPLVEAPTPPPMHFDRTFHASSLSLSRDGRTLSCVSSDGRGSAFGNVGFSKGVHYWEIKLEQADIGSVFVGVAEKPNDGSGSSHTYDKPPRLDRWHGWGFVNFRATYTPGAERIYGAHCHSGDTIGVLLDCDAGRISFFFDGLKYGEHILNDLGCAFENISPFGFNVDGCGSGGAGQGAPSGIEGGRSGRYTAQGCVRPRTLWPIVGLRNPGDRVSFSSKWSSSYGVDSASTLRNILSTEEIVHTLSDTKDGKVNADLKPNLGIPRWFVGEAFAEYKRWNSGFWCRSITRGSGPFPLTTFGLDVDLDSSPLACASASALLGLNRALMSGDRVRLKRSAGRILELAEEAVVLGSFQGRLYYKIVSQKSEGGSLTEGGGRAWFWDESEVVDGLEILSDSKAKDIVLPLMDRFRCTSPGGLKVVYEGGAVIRSDLEIFEGSLNLGSIPIGTVIPKINVLERRANASGVMRYRVRFEGLEGWISSRIRGGEEESIVIPIHLMDDDSSEENLEKSFLTSGDCALEWFKSYSEVIDTLNENSGTAIDSIDSFETVAAEGVIDGYSEAQSDAFLTRTVGAICNFCEGGNPLDAPFDQVASAIAYATASAEGRSVGGDTLSSLQANAAACTAFESLGVKKLPSLQAIMARISILRAFNRRARISLPWMSIRPCQEGSAILGGMYGHGASIDRAGRSSNRELMSQWINLPSIARNFRNVRALIFTSVKQELLRSITEATTTPTPLSHDEYELPREIRTVRINRLRARRVMSGDDVEAKRKYSVFAQLQDETKSWGGAAFRRGFVAKGHGGQKRAFKMKLIGEGVNDYSGPYREAFTDALSEVLQIDANGNGSLGVLDPTPNNESSIGENRDLYMFSLNKTDWTKFSSLKQSLTCTENSIRSSFSSLIFTGDESSREVEEALVFLGRLTGTAFRHGIPLDLPLPTESVWRAMAEEESKSDALKELDSLAFQQHGNHKEKSMLILWQQRMLNSFMDGISSVLPVEIFSILTGEELRDFFCGNPDIDVDMLRRVVEYEGYNESDKVIEYFWEILREFTNEDRKRFLQFVWARNRLPLKESDFDAPFKIQKDNGNDGDQALPSASTCFFSLSLPEYKCKEHLKEKLLFAINNVTTMETDFQTNSAEIAEGYRAF